MIDDRDGKLAHIREILHARHQKVASERSSRTEEDPDDVGEAVGKKT